MPVYKLERLVVEVHPEFLSKNEATALYEKLENTAPWKTKNRRTTLTYGNAGVSYSYKFRNQEIHRTATPWEEEEKIYSIKERIRKITNNDYNYVVVQRYPNGKFGINPHKDREMKRGTDICGISLGHEERLLMLTPPPFNKIDRSPLYIPLPPGSLYILKPPTNDYWMHSIVKDDTIEPRISLTYRFTDVK